MCLAQGPQCSDAGEAQTRSLSVSSQALYHWATALPLYQYLIIKLFQICNTFLSRFKNGAISVVNEARFAKMEYIQSQDTVSLNLIYYNRLSLSSSPILLVPNSHVLAQTTSDESIHNIVNVVEGAELIVMGRSLILMGRRFISHLPIADSFFKVSKVAKIRNRYNQVPHLTQDTNGKVTNSQKTPQTRAKRSALSQQVTTKHI